MTTYTDGQIEEVAAKLDDGISIEHGRPSPMKAGAAIIRQLLAERQAAKAGVLTEEVVAIAVHEFNSWMGFDEDDEDGQSYVAMRAALASVWPTAVGDGTDGIFALKQIVRLANRPFPDPGAHSERSFSNAVFSRWVDAQNIARAAISAAEGEKS